MMTDEKWTKWEKQTYYIYAPQQSCPKCGENALCSSGRETVSRCASCGEFVDDVVVGEAFNGVMVRWKQGKEQSGYCPWLKMSI